MKKKEEKVFCSCNNKKPLFSMNPPVFSKRQFGPFGPSKSPVTLANACELAPFVASVRGVGGETMSVSDQWLITLKPNAITYDGELLKQVFLKIIPENVTHPNPILLLALENLKKEIFVYANIIKPILDEHVCPFFLPVLTVSYNCQAEALIAMLTNKSNVQPFDPLQVFTRNMTMTLHGNNGPGQCFFLNKEPNNGANLKKFVTGEPATQVQDPDNVRCISQNIKAIVEDQTYTLLVTKAITSNFNAADYVTDMWTAQRLDELHLYYFQFSIACLVMLLNQVNHNDLHLLNVMIEKLPKKEKVVYGVKDIVYVYETDVIPLVFDFDRAKSPRLGDTFGDDSQTWLQCVTDLWSSFFQLYAGTNDPVIPQCLFLPDKVQQATRVWDTAIAKLPTDDPNVNYLEVGKSIIMQGVMYLRDVEDIVFEWGRHSNVVGAYSIQDPGLPEFRQNATHIYFIPPEMFLEHDQLRRTDYVLPLYLALNPDNMQQQSLNEDAIIQKKQELAKNKLKLLYLQLQKK